MKRINLIICISAILACIIGCEPKPLIKPITLDTAGVKPAVDYKPLATVLQRAVNKRGFIDMDKLATVTGDLDKQLKLLAVTGPGVTPSLVSTREDKLAYWYNARAAWSLKLAMIYHKNDRKHCDGMADHKFPLNDRTMTLNGIDRKIHALGSSMAVVAAPSADLRRAALPQKPFEPKGILKLIRSRATDFVDDSKRFIVDVEKQEIQFPPVLWQYRKAIMNWYNRNYGAPQATLATAMLQVVTGSAARRLQSAIGYKCVEDHRQGELAIVKEWPLTDD